MKLQIKGHYLIVGKCGVGKTLLAELIEAAINEATDPPTRATKVECYNLWSHTTKAGLHQVMKRVDVLIFVADTIEQFQSLRLDKEGVTIARTIHLTKHRPPGGSR